LIDCSRQIKGIRRRAATGSRRRLLLLVAAAASGAFDLPVTQSALEAYQKIGIASVSYSIDSKKSVYRYRPKMEHSV